MMEKVLFSNSLLVLLLSVLNSTVLYANRLVVEGNVPISFTELLVNKVAINVFDMQLTAIDEICTGNGQIAIDINNTEAGAEFEFQLSENQFLNKKK